ncbi:MAG: MFS transporter [Desulfobacteraceae bacterium]|jgi:NNP family nitrate/nitrite transporter-like MFS transporter
MKVFLLPLFWCSWYLNFSTRTLISPVLPIIEDELAISHALAGSIFSFMSVGYTFSLFLSGLLAPRIGYKKSIMLGFATLSVTLFSMKYATTYHAVAAACLFIGIGAGIYLPSVIPLLTEVFVRGNWGKAIAVHDTAASFSILSVPLLTAFALRWFQWRTLFIIISGACLIAVIAVSAFAPDPRPDEGKKSRFSHLVRRTDFWIMAVLWTFAAASNLGLYNVIPLFLVKEKGLQLEVANTIFGVSRIGGFFVAMLAGFLADRYGVKRILSLALLATGLSTIGLAAAQPFPLLVAMLITQATVGTAFFPVGLVALSKLTTLTERSAFTGGTIAIGVVVGLGLTPALLGAVADIWNFQIGIFVLGAFAALSCMLVSKLQEI